MNEACNVTTALSAFSSISLEEMSTIRLMNRTDTKYIVSLSALMDVLQRASNCYRVQEVQGERNIVYHTTYLDTPDYAMYLAHQNGRVIREKIRVRTYVSSGLTFLEVKKKIFSGFDASLEGEFRTRDGLQTVERWSGSAGVSYKMFRWLKASAGYTFIHYYHPMEVTKKGNYIPEYWQPKHRVNLSLTGKVDWRRFTFSLRERWQYTYRPSQSVPKFDGDDGSVKNDEYISGKGKNVLRSRLQVEYNIRKCAFTPYTSCELSYSLNEIGAFEKLRWTLGTEWKLSKKHALDFYYLYQNKADDDEANGHVIGAGYSFKF